MATKNLEISKRLKSRVIDQLGWSNKTFAEEVEIHVNSAGNYLNKGVVPEWDVLLRICKKINLDPNFLLQGSVARTEIDDLLDKARWVLECNHEEMTPSLKQNIVTSYNVVLRDPPAAKEQDDSPFPERKGTVG